MSGFVHLHVHTEYSLLDLSLIHSYMCIRDRAEARVSFAPPATAEAIIATVTEAGYEAVLS